MRVVVKTLTLLAWIVLVPTAALAQAVIAGTVKDSSGARCLLAPVGNGLQTVPA